MPPKHHARLSASSSERWQHCTGSVRMVAGLPDTDTFYKQEGRAAHALAEWALTTGSLVSAYGADVIPIRTQDGNLIDWPITEDMIDYLGLYVEAVREAVSVYEFAPGTHVEMHIEQKLNLALLHPPEEMFGTGDVVLIITHADGSRGLHIFDLKYGAGVVVDVVDNSQLHYYICGALLVEMGQEVFNSKSTFVVGDEESMLNAALRAFSEIQVTIVQPRAYHPAGPVRTQIVTADTVRAFATALMAKARETQDLLAPLTPGLWCRFCPAAAHCPALATHNNLVAADEFETGLLVETSIPDPARLSLAEVADFYQKGELLRMWLTALEARMVNALAHGEAVPGWKLVSKRATRKWADPLTLVADLKAMGFKDPLIYAPRVVRSVAQLETLVGKKRLPEPLITKTSPGYKLAPESDARPAVVLSPADDFPLLPPGDEADHAESE